uniref:Uncharacterized protein n=1 Tax=Aegilops tauschii subsp. strangulata TaxID=200361 RepID=A0A453CNQ8_AEGTS
GTATRTGSRAPRCTRTTRRRRRRRPRRRGGGLALAARRPADGRGARHRRRSRRSRTASPPPTSTTSACPCLSPRMHRRPLSSRTGTALGGACGVRRDGARRVIEPGQEGMGMG